jgi:hypothetical protein
MLICMSHRYSISSHFLTAFISLSRAIKISMQLNRKLERRGMSDFHPCLSIVTLFNIEIPAPRSNWTYYLVIVRCVLYHCTMGSWCWIPRKKEKLKKENYLATCRRRLDSLKSRVDKNSYFSGSGENRGLKIGKNEQKWSFNPSIKVSKRQSGAI